MSSASASYSGGPMYRKAGGTCPNCQTTDDLKKCTRCLGVAYCCVDCQRKHWSEQHKNKCADIGQWNLIQAIEHHDLDYVRKLSKSSSSKVVNGDCQSESDGCRFLQFNRPVIACVRYDNVDALRILLDSGHLTKIDVEDSDGDTALHMAASKHDVAMISLLLQHGADPNHCSQDGLSVLMMATRNFDVNYMLPDETIDQFQERKRRTLDLLMQHR